MFNYLTLPPALSGWLQKHPRVYWARTREDLIGKVLPPHTDSGTVSLEGCKQGRSEAQTYPEVTLVRCTNGYSINFLDPNMRKRDSRGLLVGDRLPTNQPRFEEKTGTSFDLLRSETLEWLFNQEINLSLHPLGGFFKPTSLTTLLIAPASCAFFSASMADLQGLLTLEELQKTGKRVATVLYLAPPFRHTHFSGQQMVVHHRLPELYEIFAYHLYPGLSSKNGMYGPLTSAPENRDTLLLRGSVVQVETPYDSVTTLMHEGPGGSGKSEMLEYPQRTEDGRLLLGENALTLERRYLPLPRGCVLHPLADDMAVSPLIPESGQTRTTVADAEKSWFIRLDHITEYGSDPLLEKTTIHPQKPLLFYNLRGREQATCLIWEHIRDEQGKICDNPRVILPRDIVNSRHDSSCEVHLRNFGLQTPLCTSTLPTYGVLGFLHLLPPALAWLWRILSPCRGVSAFGFRGEGLVSEGVGSFGPFSPSNNAEQADRILQHILVAPHTRFSLTPNQYVGAWKVGFMPQWVAREYLARRGMAPFKDAHLEKARCSLLGYTLKTMQIEGSSLPGYLLQVHEQPEVGDEGYALGAQIIENFFKTSLETYLKSGLSALGKSIVECCLDGGSIEDYEKLAGKCAA